MLLEFATPGLRDDRNLVTISISDLNSLASLFSLAGTNTIFRVRKVFPVTILLKNAINKKEDVDRSRMLRNLV